MKYVLLVVVVIIIFSYWWKNNWRSYYGEGIGRLKKNDFHGAQENFLIALKKNNNNWQISHYVGVSFKANGDRFNSRDSIIYKKNAIFSFLDATRKNPTQRKSNNMIEMILVDEKVDEVFKELIDYTKKEIKENFVEIQEQFSYITDMELNR